MAEPKKRLTSARSGARRSHLAHKAKKLTECPKCKAVVPSHQVCSKCGFYNGNDVMELEKKEQAKAARRKEEEEKTNE
ncbi:TPA: 50S ribosomal protein L32 [Candidatus Berkelbacteria bacterium]|uniref:Large ribosomal subunit protein bL32 n=1 Tax=Berkelbacteria bacterium GW2011_GWE1_39_12 TaxID=1618337 RepID=A0A0G4B4L6_9BACT|nr:MAG: 50S ribosomal protein L32, large subunit ribosomal protein L32 [Berkelbacteria bacterium GW2011_GWE1_39_12]HBO60160.1 50S ribosomal protein L32 [Candidatus Berkelbacteria bacterium]